MQRREPVALVVATTVTSVRTVLVEPSPSPRVPVEVGVAVLVVGGGGGVLPPQFGVLLVELPDQGFGVVEFSE